MSLYSDLLCYPDVLVLIPSYSISLKYFWNFILCLHLYLINCYCSIIICVTHNYEFACQQNWIYLNEWAIIWTVSTERWILITVIQVEVKCIFLVLNIWACLPLFTYSIYSNEWPLGTFDHIWIDSPQPLTGGYQIYQMPVTMEPWASFAFNDPLPL